MFSGIVEETGRVIGIKPNSKSIRLTVEVCVVGTGLKLGDSVAVNGCCLTAVKLSRPGKTRRIEFDLLLETWNRTNLQYCREGSLVNLERSLRFDGRLGGHFVTGHIDGTGKITRWERQGQDHVLDISTPASIMKYIVHKGSIALDGISLTVAETRKRSFRIWIIPHTFEVTALQSRQIGDLVNLEADLLGKYVEKFLAKKSSS